MPNKIDVLQCVCAMREIFRAEEAEAVVLALYPRLFAALLINIASVVGAKPPKVSKVCSHVVY